LIVIIMLKALSQKVRRNRGPEKQESKDHSPRTVATTADSVKNESDIHRVGSAAVFASLEPPSLNQPNHNHNHKQYDSLPCVGASTTASCSHDSSSLAPLRPRAGSSTRQLDFVECEQADVRATLQRMKSSSVSETNDKNDDDAAAAADDDDDDEQRQVIHWRRVPAERIAVRSANYLSSRKSRSHVAAGNDSSSSSNNNKKGVGAALLSRKQNLKSPSLGSLYECIKVDFIESQHRLPNMSSRVELPLVDFDDKPHEPKTWQSPDLFVVTLSMPSKEPKESDENQTEKERTLVNSGPSITICMYYAMTPQTRKLLKLATASPGSAHWSPDHPEHFHPNLPAVRLLEEWCRRAPRDPKFQGRFKLIPHCDNIADLKLPKWIARWNAKPLLIKRTGKTGFLYQHPEGNGRPSCLEMEVSFHPFPWATKQAIHYLRQHVLHKLLFTFAFVLEGRSEAELPETLLGLCQLCFPRPEHAIPARDFFGTDECHPPAAADAAAHLDDPTSSGEWSDLEGHDNGDYDVGGDDKGASFEVDNDDDEEP